ncbi:MAG: hypothetical protein ACO31V_06920, partial [Ilumatobacteraceae bacterium]
LSLGRRLVAAHFVIDETTAMTTAQSHPRLARTAFWVTALSLFVGLAGLGFGFVQIALRA